MKDMAAASGHKKGTLTPRRALKGSKAPVKGALTERDIIPEQEAQRE